MLVAYLLLLKEKRTTRRGFDDSVKPFDNEKLILNYPAVPLDRVGGSIIPLFLHLDGFVTLQIGKDTFYIRKRRIKFLDRSFSKPLVVEMTKCGKQRIIKALMVDEDHRLLVIA